MFLHQNPWKYSVLAIFRGESNNGLWDRFDWTLLILRKWYENLKNDNFKIEDELKKQYPLNEDEIKRTVGLFEAFGNSKNWLILFNNFEGFIDFLN